MAQQPQKKILTDEPWQPEEPGFRFHHRLQALEDEMRSLVYPFIDHPKWLYLDPPREDMWSVADHLEYVFHVNLQLVINLHALPDQKARPSRKPSLMGRIILLFRWLPEGTDQKLAPGYEPGNHDVTRDIQWLKEHFKFWNDKLAGMYFLSGSWPKKVLNQKHESLGYLSGYDWMRVMRLHARNHRRQVEKLLKS